MPLQVKQSLNKTCRRYFMLSHFHLPHNLYDVKLSSALCGQEYARMTTAIYRTERVFASLTWTALKREININKTMVKLCRVYISASGLSFRWIAPFYCCTAYWVCKFTNIDSYRCDSIGCRKRKLVGLNNDDVFLRYANHMWISLNGTTIGSFYNQSIKWEEYRRKGWGSTIAYYGKRKDGDKFMDYWNNNGRILWREITPGQVKDLHVCFFLSRSLYCRSIS
jgi:hypothetical protein